MCFLTVADLSFVILQPQVLQINLYFQVGTYVRHSLWENLGKFAGCTSSINATLQNALYFVQPNLMLLNILIT